MDIFNKSVPLVCWSVLTCSALLVACDSGTVILENSATDVITAQAIDGYIVDGKVMCDDDENGRTAAGGWLECPANTAIITVTGGRDVGFDETATTGGVLFSGSLRAPGDARFITPVSSLAMELASSGGSFNRTKYDDSLLLIQDRLGLQSIDLAGNPATDVELARLNVEINLLVQQFSSSTTDYDLTMQALSEVFSANTSIDITDGVALTSAVNEQLTTIAPYLSLNSNEEVTIGSKINAELESINTSETLAELENSTDLVQLPAAFKIDQNETFLALKNHYYGNSLEYFTLADFQSPVTDGALYNMAIREYRADKLIFNSNALTIDQTLSNASINVALEIDSMLDSRRLSVVINDINLSMDAGDKNSIEMQLPQGTLLNAEYVDINNVVTQVTEIAEEDLLASSGNGNFSIDLDDVREQLYKHGYPNFLRQSGHYKMTVVVEGIKFEISNNGVVSTPAFHTISTGSETVSGFGLQGYFSLY